MPKALRIVAHAAIMAGVAVRAAAAYACSYFGYWFSQTRA